MIEYIKLNNLKLSIDNPRLTDSQTEKEELEKMIKDQGKKLVKLASDIINYGLNPLDIVAVYPSLESGKYIVAEGNRRVTALKLLSNPELAINIDKVIYQSFKKISIGVMPISEIQCYIFKSELDKNLVHWIEIKHQGENEGRGTASWSAIQKARFDKKTQGESLILDFWENLEKLKILSGDEILEITKTNWERILRDYGLDFLGLKKQKNAYIIPLDDIIEFEKKIKEIHKLLANQTVAIVYDQERIELFFDKVSMNLYGHPIIKDTQLSLDDLNTSIKNTQDISEPAIPASPITEPKAESNSKVGQLSSPQKPKPSNIKKDLFNNCVTVIPYGYPIRSDNPRINRIIKELKTLNVNDYPNACGVLLRLLFELSAKLLMEKADGDDHTKDNFQPIINGAARNLKDKGLINNYEHSAINKEIDIIRSLFDGYMHNTDSYPSSESIKSIFKAHCKFIKLCLEN